MKKFLKTSLVLTLVAAGLYAGRPPKRLCR
jgi:hypothetical protein